MRRLLAIALLATLLGVDPAQAVESFPVTSTADAGTGSLREAIEAANKAPGADSIPIGVTGTIALQTPLPPIVNTLVIRGPGAADLTIERQAGAAPFRILTFPDILASIVRDVTISGGLDPLGAGILSETEGLTLIGVVVAGNEARSEGASQAVARGGGVASLGPLTVLDSTIHGNKAIAQGGSTETTASGGGIYALGSLTLERSTVSGNSAMTPAGDDQGGAAGGGIQAGAVEIASSTISGNSVAGAAFATASNLVSPTGTARNTIVSNPQGEGESCFGIIDSDGYNLDEDGSCQFGQGSDLAGVDPLLGPLAANGGPTPTHALLPGSIAIDRGNSFGDTTDQRGLPRPSDFPAIGNKEGGDGSDIGAFELQVPPDAPLPILVATEPGDSTPPRTRIVSGPARVGYDRLAKFRFASSEGQSSFQCRLDTKHWRKCRSPYKLAVKPGKHIFKVRAIDRFGNVDPTPARFGWRVKPLS